MFVTETVSPIQMAEPATGCYLKAAPCGRHQPSLWHFKEHDLPLGSHQRCQQKYLLPLNGLGRSFDIQLQISNQEMCQIIKAREKMADMQGFIEEIQIMGPI